MIKINHIAVGSELLGIQPLLIYSFTVCLPWRLLKISRGFRDRAFYLPA